jgi:hypothetical protein
MHVIQGKPEQFSPEEEKAFEAADNLFRGAILSVLAENLVDTYLLLPSGKEDCWINWTLGHLVSINSKN